MTMNKSALLILITTVCFIAVMSIGQSQPRGSSDTTEADPRSSSAQQAPSSSDAANIGSARDAFLDFMETESILSDDDIDSIYCAVQQRTAAVKGNGSAFIDSLALRFMRSTSTEIWAIPSYIEKNGAEVWFAVEPDVAYPEGFTLSFIDEIEHASGLAEEVEPEESEIAPILFGLIIIMFAAKLGGDLVERFHQPAVLGELIFGMIIGNLALIGIDALEPLKHHVTIEILAEIGVIILLFEVGLESNLKEMLSVGLTSLFVAMIGVIAPFFLGWGVSAIFFPDESIFIHIFIGATLTATSVGITARVLRDIGRIRTREAKIILGAAVIDDILGLVVLAVVVGIIGAHNTGGTLSSLRVLWIILKAFLFIFGSIALGSLLAPSLFKLASKLRVQSILITFALMFCFLFAFAADRVGLAPIVGAFAAGMILSDVNFKDIFRHEERRLEELLGPISAFLVPIFFVYMGMNVELSTFGNLQVIVFALVLTTVAIIGKQICSLAGIFERKINSWVIGVGMIPRGEVGLIFAGIGAKLVIDGEPVVNPNAYSAVIIMVVITTLVTPPILKLLFTNHR